MARKKTKYEKKGLVRQIAGSIFASHKERTEIDDDRWRPRKNQFEKLDAELEDDTETNNFEEINRAFSTESETVDYRRGELLFATKKTAHERGFGTVTKAEKKRRDLSNVVIKPSVRDQQIMHAVPVRVKKLKHDRSSSLNTSFDGAFGDPFSTFANQGKRSDEISIDASESKCTTSSRQTSSTKDSAAYTVKSDPLDFFSRKPAKLTKENLDNITKTSMGSGDAAIENINPRSQFHQFTIDEDKESTVVDPVSFPGLNFAEESDEEDVLEEDSIYSLGYTSKGTLIKRPNGARKQSLNPIDSAESQFKRRSPCMQRSLSGDLFGDFGDIKEESFEDPFFPELQSSLPTSSDKKKDETRTKRGSHHLSSSNSLAYSESTFDAPVAGSQAESSGPAIVNKILSQRNVRTPLSSLNVSIQSPAHCDFGFKHASSGSPAFPQRPDPDATWADFPKSFRKKPDPQGSDARYLFQKATDFEGVENVIPSPNVGVVEKSALPRARDSLQLRGRRALEQETSFPEDCFLAGSGEENEAHYEYGYTVNREGSSEEAIGIQSFPKNALGSRTFSSVSSHEGTNEIDKYRFGYAGEDDTRRSSTSVTRNSHSVYYHGLPKSQHYPAGVVHHSSDENNSVNRQLSAPKPLALPSNAIMASMLFRRHHNIDTQVVDEKLREREAAYKHDSRRGDIPQTIQAVDGVSCVSSFSEDTAAQLEVWRKPTRDLLDRYASSRRTNTDFKKRIQEQRTEAMQLYEA